MQKKEAVIFDYYFVKIKFHAKVSRLSLFRINVQFITKAYTFNEVAIHIQIA